MGSLLILMHLLVCSDDAATRHGHQLIPSQKLTPQRFRPFDISEPVSSWWRLCRFRCFYIALYDFIFSCAGLLFGTLQYIASTKQCNRFTGSLM
ncbi:hypothetical protein DFH29DRAFT_920681, partial [Suillus ampliporus]